MELFKKGDKVGRYTVNDFIKKGASAESYTVYGTDDMLYFLKVFDMTTQRSNQLFEGKEVYEILFCKELNEEQNDNIIRYVDSGEVRKNNKNYHYLVTRFYQGDLLNQAVEEGGPFDAEDAIQITLCVLNGLSYMHSKALLHNDITPSNIMLQELEDGMLLPTIIDLGHVSYMVMGRPSFYVDDLQPFFRAPETFRGIYTPKSDVFSVGALMYYLLFGVAPWEVDLSEYGHDQNLIKSVVKDARKTDLVLETEDIKLPDFLQEILRKALALKPNDRFASTQEFFEVLMERLVPELPDMVQIEEEGEPVAEKEAQLSGETVADESNKIVFKKGSGNGFDQVAGRDDLKEQLRKEVIFALQNPEKAQLYKLPKINGILLYGPPGCGKSLVMESFAEELGFNYTVLSASKFGNIYQPGAVENLQRVFDAAALKAPFVLGFDEMEYLIPNPGDGSVNQEAVAVMNLLANCAANGILVVATSNQPDQIDPLIMRPGCIDRVFFVSQPDEEARKDIFRRHLSERPTEELDYDELAKMSEDFVAGDITETVNEAAMTAAYMDVPISQKILVDVLRYKNPTYSTRTKIGYCK